MFSANSLPSTTTARTAASSESIETNRRPGTRRYGCRPRVRRVRASGPPALVGDSTPDLRAPPSGDWPPWPIPFRLVRQSLTSPPPPHPPQRVYEETWPTRCATTIQRLQGSADAQDSGRGGAVGLSPMRPRLGFTTYPIFILLAPCQPTPPRSVARIESAGSVRVLAVEFAIDPPVGDQIRNALRSRLLYDICSAISTASPRSSCSPLDVCRNMSTATPRESDRRLIDQHDARPDMSARAIASTCCCAAAHRSRPLLVAARRVTGTWKAQTQIFVQAARARCLIRRASDSPRPSDAETDAVPPARAYAMLHDLLGSEAPELDRSALPLEANRARGRPDQTHNRIQQRALSIAVGAEQSDELALPYFERQIA